MGSFALNSCCSNAPAQLIGSQQRGEEPRGGLPMLLVWGAGRKLGASSTRALEPDHSISQPSSKVLKTDHLQSRLAPSKLPTHPSLGAPKQVPRSPVGKESACNAGDLGSIPGSGRSPGEGNGYPLQYSCLENPVDRGAWQATVHRVTRVRHNLALFFFL